MKTRLAKVLLTKSVIDKAVYPGRQFDGGSWEYIVIWDTKISGFGLRLLPSGRKVFILKYRLSGIRHTIVIGDFGPLTVDDARAKANKHLGDIQYEEVDPMEVKQGKVERSKATIGKLVEEYIRRHAKVNKKSWKKDQSWLNRHVLPAWKGRPVASITKNDVSLLYGKIRAGHKGDDGKIKSTPYEANRVFEVIRKMFGLAIVWGYLPEDAVNPTKGTKKVDRYTEKPRTRWLQEGEIPKFAAAVNAEKNPYVRAAFWLYLLTGLRKNELLRARWNDVDLEGGTLYVGETKNGSSHTVPLDIEAIKILKEIPRVVGNPYVFVGHKRGAHLSDVQNFWESIRKAAGMDDVRIHDLRRTFASRLVNTDVPMPYISKMLNHSSPAITSASYAHVSTGSLKPVVEEYGRRLMESAKPKEPGEIVDFEEAKNGQRGR